MFKRLLKHEFKSTYKDFFVLFCIVILASLLFTISLKYNSSILFIIFFITYIFSLYAMIGLSLYYFYLIICKSIFSKQGYLTFALPIKTSQLIFSKLIVVLTYIALIFLSVFISIDFIFLLSVDFAEIPFLSMFNNFLSINYLFSSIEYFINIIKCFMFIIFIYSISNSGLIKKKRKTNPIIFALLIIVIFNILKSIFYFEVNDLYLCIDSNNNFSIHFFNEFPDSLAGCHAYSISKFIINIIEIVSLYFLSKYLIDKKLELQ